MNVFVKVRQPLANFLFSFVLNQKSSHLATGWALSQDVALTRVDNDAILSNENQELNFKGCALDIALSDNVLV